MTDDLRTNLDLVSRSFTPYLVNYRLSSRAPVSAKGDRGARYKALRGVLEPLSGSELSLFKDDGHIATSSWIIHSDQSIDQVGRALEALLVPGHDMVAVFEIHPENRWSMPDTDGDRAQDVPL